MHVRRITSEQLSHTTVWLFCMDNRVERSFFVFGMECFCRSLTELCRNVRDKQFLVILNVSSLDFTHSLGGKLDVATIQSYLN